VSGGCFPPPLFFLLLHPMVFVAVRWVNLGKEVSIARRGKMKVRHSLCEVWCLVLVWQRIARVGVNILISGEAAESSFVLAISILPRAVPSDGGA
jgi:hypothetical protein